jgi:hypothetical protein
MQDILDNLPVATLTFLVGVAILVIGYIGDDIAFDEVWEKLLFLGGGSAGIGYVRNQAGKGVKKGP